MENDLKRHVQMIAENAAFEALQCRGYDVQRNGYHDHADLVIGTGYTIEVKGALWTSHQGHKGRYQFNTRQHPHLYMLLCICENPQWFIIPGNAIGHRKNIAIYGQDPQEYAGQWAKYRNTFNSISKEIDKCLNHQH